MKRILRELHRIFPIEYEAAQERDAEYMPNFLARSHRRQQAKLFKRLKQEDMDDGVRRMAQMELERLYLPFHLLPVQSVDGNFVQVWADDEDFADSATFIPGFGKVLSQAQDNMREGVRRKIVLPKSLATKIVKNLERLADRLQGKNPKKIKKDGLPALEDMILFMRREYIPYSRDSLGYVHLGAVGVRMYDSLVRRYTNNEVQNAQEAIRRIGKQISSLRIALASHAPLPSATPLMTRQEVAHNIERILARMRREGEFSNGIPPFKIKWVRRAKSADSPIAFYQPPPRNTMYLNPKLLKRLLPVDLKILMLHEIGGHHCMEQRVDQNKFGVRKIVKFIHGNSSDAERCGMRCEVVAERWGKECARAAHEWWLLRNVRGLVDARMHHSGWSPNRCKTLFKAMGVPSRIVDVDEEIVRYASWPGQALAYVFGRLPITECLCGE